MNKIEINEQMLSVIKETSLVTICVRKFMKECRKLPKGRVVITRKFHHKETNQTYILCMFQNNGVASTLLVAEVDHGKQKWYYIISEDLTDTTDAYSTHLFKRYAEREGIPYVMPNIITRYFMENTNIVKIYESEDEQQSAYASRNGISLCRWDKERGITKHCTYVSRDMLGNTQEEALQVILGDIDEIDDIQHNFKPIHKATLKDVELHKNQNFSWKTSTEISSQTASKIYKQYFEDIEE